MAGSLIRSTTKLALWSAGQGYVGMFATMVGAMAIVLLTVLTLQLVLLRPSVKIERTR